MRPLLFSLAVSAVLAQHAVAHGQTLPPASRTVYKCEVNGKVVYSDSPCLGARRVDVTPTRGLDRSTGQARTGSDVRDERLNEQMAEALRPLLNETPEERALRHRRSKLSPEARAQCRSLDARIRDLEDEERAASRENLETVQRGLFTARTEHREFGC
jgi:hypothetical protein